MTSSRPQVVRVGRPLLTPAASSTAVVDLITNNNENAYLSEGSRGPYLLVYSNLLLKVCKTKELTLDFRKKKRRHYTLLNINRSLVERVDTFNYFGVYITEGLT